MRIGLGEKNPLDKIEAQVFEEEIEEKTLDGRNIILITVISSIIVFCLIFGVIFYFKKKH